MGKNQNSYAKPDTDVTLMRMKVEYMQNGQGNKYMLQCSS